MAAVDLKLRDEEGYYSREVEVAAAPGVHFKIRELDDAELKAARDAERTLADAAGVGGTDLAPDEMMKLAVARSIAADGDEVVKLRNLTEEALDAVLEGVVGWDLKRGFEPGLQKLLPNPVKLQLTRCIIADSTLQADEARFLG